MFAEWPCPTPDPHHEQLLGQGCQINVVSDIFCSNNKCSILAGIKNLQNCVSVCLVLFVPIHRIFDHTWLNVRNVYVRIVHNLVVFVVRCYAQRLTGWGSSLPDGPHSLTHSVGMTSHIYILTYYHAGSTTLCTE